MRNNCGEPTFRSGATAPGFHAANEKERGTGGWFLWRRPLVGIGVGEPEVAQKILLVAVSLSPIPSSDFFGIALVLSQAPEMELFQIAFSHFTVKGVRANTYLI